LKGLPESQQSDAVKSTQFLILPADRVLMAARQDIQLAV
jgi:hypothetical protein